MAEREKGRGAEQTPARRSERGGVKRYEREPFSFVDWMFDRLQRDFFGEPSSGFGRAMQPFGEEGVMDRIPRVEMREEGDELIVTAELPGIDPKDIEVQCQDDVLTLRGESREEREEEGRRVSSHARFFRQVPLPLDVDVDKASATCKHGQITIRFPKTEAGRNARRIPIRSGEGEGGRAERAA